MDTSPSRPSPRNSHSNNTPVSRLNHTRQPSLLPAFEPFSSSPPGLPSKRKFNAIDDEHVSYPTPVPTSSTGILPSSPPRRPALQRTLSTLSERAPLSDLPSVIVPSNGESVRFGRSSNSSDHQFPTNRHISRVHVTAQYQPPSELHASSSILVKCLGWNGAKIRCGGQLYELDKGDSWVSTQPSAEIMLDVMDCRVMVKWPVLEQLRSNSVRSSSAWTEESCPQRAFTGLENTILPSSPPAMRVHTPISPLSARRTVQNPSSDILTSEATFVSEQTAVHVYEDDNSDHVYADPDSPSKPVHSRPPLCEQASVGSFSSSNADDISDQENEENDPVVHSFGPFGSNLLNRLGSFSHSSPLQPQQKKKKVLKYISESPKHESPVSTKKIDSVPKKQIQESPVKNHVINHNLPADLKTCTGIGIDNEEELTDSDLRRVLHSIPCVGEINREGKDAAGKPLENEFYYVPEMDDNTMRRDAVLGGRGGTGLRSVRKNHKQYYWKKPRV